MRTVDDADEAMIRQAVDLIVGGGLVELRDPKHVGLFDDAHRDDLVRAALHRSGRVPGVYITLNEIAEPRVQRAAEGIRDEDIRRRCWLPFDFDPVRPKGTSSTDAEHEDALLTAYAVRAHLRKHGWPDPIFADSGNGGHLLYAVVLGNDSTSRDLIRNCLKAIAGRFDTDAVKTDTSVSNAARIWKLYGTLAAKGTPTEERPHRLARILEMPEDRPVDVEKEFLEALAVTVRKPASPAKTSGTGAGVAIAQPYVRAAVDGEVAAFVSAGVGDRHRTLNTAAFRLGTLVGAGVLDPEVVQGALTIAAAPLIEEGRAREVERTIRDGLEAGIRRPRSVASPEMIKEAPPMTEQPVEPPFVPTGPSQPGPPDPAAYHGILGEILRVVGPHSEAHPVAIIAHLLAMVGNVIGRTPYFLVEADRHYTNLFFAIVGATSRARKGTSASRAEQLIGPVDEEWARDRIMPGGVSTGEGLIHAVRDEVWREKPVTEKGGHVTGYEQVRIDAGVSDKRLMVIEPEFSRILKMGQRDGNILSEVVRSAWDKGKLVNGNKNSAEQATGAHVSIVGHITQDELLRTLDSTEAGNGFGNRFIWLWVKRPQLLPHGGSLDERALEPFQRRLKGIIDLARQTGRLTDSPAARELWEELYSRLTAERPGLLGAILARSEAQVRRLATLYALLDETSVIEPVHLEAATALWEYSEASARYIFGEHLGDPVADTIHEALAASSDGLTRTEMSNLFGRNQNKAQIDRALGALAKHGMAFPREERTEGRTAERWFALPPIAPAGAPRYERNESDEKRGGFFRIS